jgi:putative Mn2+ efflux pump MntP
MSLFSIIWLGIGLAMDAFSVSVCKGLALKKIRFKDYLSVALWFGIFQGLMPFTGCLLGSLVASFAGTFTGWIAFGLLGAIGVNMIWEALHPDDEDVDAGMSAKEMFVLAIATSIDALAVGASFSLVGIEILPEASMMVNLLIACVIIAVETGIICDFGLKIGEIAGKWLKNYAGIFGGVILILIGLRILISAYL